MTSLFGHGNPLATQVGQRIDQATDANLPTEDWALNIAICDVINETDDGPKDAIKALRKKIQTHVGKNYRVVMYCLTVLETCVKNCGKRFHIQVANKDFLHELIKIIGPKNDPPQQVQEKVLSLIQTWADAFRHSPELKEVEKMYMDLKAKGIEFPMTDLDSMAPIHTPFPLLQAGLQPVQPQLPQVMHIQPSYPPQTMASPQHSPNRAPRPAYPTPQQMTKLKGELSVVNGNIHVFSEMLSDLSPSTADQSDLELLQELNRTCRNIQQRIVELIDNVANEEVTVELLSINDALNNVFIRYDRFERYRMGQVVVAPNLLEDHEVDNAPPPSYDQVAEQCDPNVGNLIDFADTHTASSQLAQISINGESEETAEKTPNDDFDMFAQSRKSFDQNKQSFSSNVAYQNQVVDEVRGGLGHAVNAKSSMTDKDIMDLQEKETDYDEMERWLTVNDPNYKGTNTQMPSVTSSEFDEFLSQRAAVSDVPEITTRNTSTGRHIEKDEDDSHALFAL